MAPNQPPEAFGLTVPPHRVIGGIVPALNQTNPQAAGASSAAPRRSPAGAARLASAPAAALVQLAGWAKAHRSMRRNHVAAPTGQDAAVPAAARPCERGMRRGGCCHSLSGCGDTVSASDLAVVAALVFAWGALSARVVVRRRGGAARRAAGAVRGGDRGRCVAAGMARV